MENYLQDILCKLETINNYLRDRKEVVAKTHVNGLKGFIINNQKEIDPDLKSILLEKITASISFFNNGYYIRAYDKILQIQSIVINYEKNNNK